MKRNHFIRTKQYKWEILFGIVFIIMLFGSINVTSVTRHISDTSDDVTTFIRNSNGSYYDASCANILQAMWDLNSTDGGTIWLPAGTITIDEEIDILDNITIIGSGIPSTILFSDTAGGFIPLTISGRKNIVLQSFTLDMNSKGSNGVYITSASENVWIDGVSFQHCGFQSIYSSGNCRFIYLTNIKVNESVNPASHGFGLADIYDSVIDNCIFEAEFHDAAQDGIDFSSGYNCTVSNIIIRGPGWHDGIKINDLYVSNCSFSNINIFNINNSGFKIQDTKHCNFNNINIRDTGHFGMTIYGGGDRVHHCNFNNINLVNCEYGFNMDGDNCTFSNLNTYNTAGCAFTIGGNDNVITNSVFDNMGLYNSMVNANNTIISNSRITNGESYGLIINLCSGFKIVDCIFENNALDAIDTTINPCNNYSIIGCTFEDNALAIDCHANDDYINIISNYFINDATDFHYSSNAIIKDNIGDDTSTYLAVPDSITRLFTGSMYWDGSALQVYDGGWNEIGGGGVSGSPSLTSIRNSNNNSWTVTEGNLHEAIWDLNGTDGGTVWVGDNLTITEEIRFTNSNVILDFMNKIVTLTGDISFMNVTDGVTNSFVKNVQVVSESTSTKPMIVLYMADGATWSERLFSNNFENIYISGCTNISHNYTAVYINIDCISDETGVQDNTFSNIFCWYPESLIKLDCAFGGCYANANIFRDMYALGYEIGIDFGTDEKTGFNTNLFENIMFQTKEWSTDGVRNVVGDRNRFLNCHIGDKYIATDYNYYYSLTEYANYSYISAYYLEKDYVHDLGGGTFIESSNIGHAYDNSPYTYIIFKNETDIFVQEGATGLICYRTTTFQDAVDKILVFSSGGYKASESTHITVFVRRGVYTFGSGYIGDSDMHDIRFLGEGKHNTIIKAEETVGAGFFQINGADRVNVSFENLCFEGNNQEARGIYIIHDSSSENIYIEDCVFQNFTGAEWSTAIYSQEPSSDNLTNLVVRNCMFLNNLYGVKINGDEDPSRMEWCDISNNYFENHTAAITIMFGSNTTVSDNRIVDCDEGIYMEVCNNCIVNGNIVNATNGISVCAGENNTVMNNNVIACGENPLFFEDEFNSIIKNNMGNDTSTYLPVPISLPKLFAGSLYWDGSSLQLYYGGSWNEIGGGAAIAGAPGLSLIRNGNNNSWLPTEANLRLAIADAGNDSWVYCPPGTINLTSNIKLYDLRNFTISGYGCELRVKDPATYVGSFILEVFNCSRIIVEGFELNGSCPWNATGTEFGGALPIEKTSNSTFRDMEIHHINRDGIVIADSSFSWLYNTRPSQHNLIINNHIHHCGYANDTESPGGAGIRIMGRSNMTHNIIEGNHIEYIREHGIKIYPSDAGVTNYSIRDNKILNNIISHTSQGNWDRDGGVYGRGIAAYGNNTLVDGNTVHHDSMMGGGILIGYNCIATNNHVIFEEAGYTTAMAGIQVGNNSVTGVFGQAVVADNVINGNGYADTTGISLIGNDVNTTEDTICVGNKILNVGYVGISINSNFSTVSNNVIDTTGYNGIHISDCIFTTLTNNIIRNTGDEGINVGGVNYCDISSNFIYDTAGRGMQISGDCVWNAFNDNKLKDFSNYAMEFMSGSSQQFCDISHNQVIGGNYGLLLYGIENSTVGFNTFSSSRGIYEHSDCLNNIFTNNNGLTCAIYAINSLGTDSIVKNNVGYDYSNYLALPSTITKLFSGSTWFNTTTNTLKIYNGSVWINFSTASSSGAPSLSVIRNSNNKSWTVSEANLELAINDVDTDGTVWIGDDITLTNWINMSEHDKVTLDFEDHTITMNADVPAINFSNVLYAGMKNAKIIPSATHTEDIILLHSGPWNWGTAWDKRVWGVTIENVDIVESSAQTSQHNWTGIHFWMNNESSMEHIIISDVYMYGAGTGVKVEIDGNGLTENEAQNAYMNFNTLQNVYVNRHINGLWFVDDGASRYAVSESGGVNNWYISNFITQAPANTIYLENPKIYGIRNLTGSGNVIHQFVIYDWNNVANPGYQVWLGNYSFDTTLLSGGDWDEQSNYCIDMGYENKIESSTGNPYHAVPYNYIVFQNDSGWTFAVNAKTGLLGRSGLGAYRSEDAQDVIDNVVEVANGGSVFFKKGTYELDTYIGDVDMNNMTFIGEDKNSVIFKPKDCQLASGMFACNGLNNLTFKDITFDGTDATGTSVGIYFGTNDDTTGLTVDNCIFKNFTAGTSRGIRIKPAAGIEVSNIKITKSNFVHCDYGISIDSTGGSNHYANILNNYFEDCDTSIYLYVVHNSTVTSNIFKSGTTGIDIDGCFNNIIAGNLIQGMTTEIDEDSTSDRNMIFSNVGYSVKVTHINTDAMIHNSKGNYWEATPTNIQAAIDDLTAGGTVFIPQGEYYFDSPLEPINNTHLKGCGIGNTVIITTHDFNDPNGYGLVKGYYAYKLHNITISDMTIDGNDTANCINFHAAKNCIFRDLYLNKAAGSALNMRSSCSEMLVSNLFIMNTTTNQGITCSTLNNSVITDIVIKHGGGAGNQAMDFSGCINVTVDNVYMSDTTLGVKVTGGATYHTYNCQFSNFFISDVNSDGFKIQNTENCNFNNINIENVMSSNGFVVDDANNEDLIIENLYVSNAPNVGISLTGENIHVDNVILKNATAYGIDASKLHNSTISNVFTTDVGMYNYIRNSNDLVITNFISNETRGNFGVLVEGCNRLKGDNIIVSESKGGVGLRVDTSSEVSLSNLHVKNSSNVGFYVSSSSEVHVNNFCFKDNGYGAAANGAYVAASSSFVSFSNGDIINSFQIGLSLSGDNISVSNVNIKDSAGRGISIAGEHVTVTNIKVFGSGIYNYLGGASYVLIANSMFCYNSQFGLSAAGSDNFKIVNCIFDSNGWDAFDSTATACHNYSIIGCTFNNNTNGVDCNANDDWIIITLNHFTNGDTLDDHYLSKGVVENNLGDDI